MTKQRKIINPLFCKPGHLSVKNQIVYRENDYDLEAISFRSLDMRTDLKMIHQWVNKDYSKRFWQLNGSVSLIQNTYEAILASQSTHSFIGLLKDKPICQVDIYLIIADELSDHIIAGLNDCGIHFHMAPIVNGISGLSSLMMCAFLRYYFSFKEADKMYGEPDIDNEKANQLVAKSGFEFLKPINMSYKKANLWVCTREYFFRTIHINKSL